jgi:hypothetical protein
MEAYDANLAELNKAIDLKELEFRILDLTEKKV